MFRNLMQKPPPDALLSQYLPIAHAALRDGLIKNSPADLAMAHVCAVLGAYHAATFAQSSTAAPGLDPGVVPAIHALPAAERRGCAGQARA
jgi:hypothetical protein